MPNSVPLAARSSDEHFMAWVRVLHANPKGTIKWACVEPSCHWSRYLPVNTPRSTIIDLLDHHAIIDRELRNRNVATEGQSEAGGKVFHIVDILHRVACDRRRFGSPFIPDERCVLADTIPQAKRCDQVHCAQVWQYVPVPTA